MKMATALGSKVMLSVVIPCRVGPGRPGPSRLKLALASWADQANDALEVVVVDDGSDPPVAEALADLPWLSSLQLRVLRQPAIGMCAAYNAGLGAAHGKYVLLGIDDNIISPRCVATLEAWMRQTPRTVLWLREYMVDWAYGIDDLETGALADLDPADRVRWMESVEVIDGRSRTIALHDANERWDTIVAAARLYEMTQDLERTIRDGVRHRWLAFRLGNVVAERQLITRLGGLDEQLDPAGWFADLELGLRLVDAGVPYELSDSAAHMCHLPHPKGPSTWQHERSAYVAFLSRHPCAEVAMLPLYFRLGQYMELDDYAWIAEAWRCRMIREDHG